MPTSAIKFYNDDKGYGFIAVDGEGRDLFFHISNVADKLEPNEGQRVSLNDWPSRSRAGKFEAYDLELIKRRYGAVQILKPLTTSWAL
jgi:cold shock protein